MTAPETPFDAAELSAYLDGELPPARAAEIEARLAVDAELRAEYEALREMDARWREAGAGTLFVPAVQLPSTRAAGAPLGGLAVIVLVLIGARSAGRFVEALGPSLLLNLAALALVGWVVLRLARGEGTAPSR